MNCDNCKKDKKSLFELYGQSLCLICKKRKEVEIFKKGTRIWHKNMGYGTVTVEPYHTRHFNTWTCAKYDDFVGQKGSLCGETEELTLVENL